MQPDLSDLLPPCLDRVPRFMAAVEEARRSRAPNEWRAFVRRSRPLRMWRHFLALDPFTRWGMVKPAGYAGDATLMDFTYRHPSVAHHLAQCGETGATIYAHTSAADQAASARRRIELTRDLLVANVGPLEATVVSIASGHARELECLPDSVRARARRFLAVDNDPAALAVAERSAEGLPFTPLRANVVKDDLADVPQAEVVYSLGLFDYLDDGTAAAVLEKMLAMTLDGGVCLIANLAHDAANLGYCEAVMDWWMVTRGEREMRELAARVTVASQRAVETRIERVGCFWYLRLQPGAGARTGDEHAMSVEAEAF